MSVKQAAAPAGKTAIEPAYVLRLVGTLFAICLAVSLLLGVVNAVTKPSITAAREAKIKAAMSQVLAADTYEPVETTAANVTALNRAVSGGETVGYVAQVTGNGFGGAISMVVGIAPDGTVTGVAVTEDSETANIGTKVVKDQSVLDRFVGMDYGENGITVNAGQNRFDGISGATVSSRGVTAGVNAALAAVREWG